MATKPYVQPIDIAFGEDYTEDLTFKNPDGTAYSLTGCEITVTFRDGNSRSGTELAKLQVGSGVTVTDEAGGLAQYKLPRATNEAQFTVGDVVFYDVFLTDASADEIQVVRVSPASIVESVSDP